MPPVMPQPRCVIVTDETVAKLHLATLQASLDEVGIAHAAITVPPGETSKSFATWQHVVDQMLDRRWTAPPVWWRWVAG